MKTNLSESAFGASSNHLRNQAALGPQPSATRSNFRRFATDRLDQLVALKERVTASLEQEFAGTIGSRFILQIVNEATALAATTSFPTLLLPALAEEKARNVSEWAARQRAIRDQSLTLAA